MPLHAPDRRQPAVPLLSGGLAAGVLAVALAGCTDPAGTPRAQPIEVRTETARPVAFSSYVDTVGTVEAIDEVELSARADGRIEQLFVKQGSRVRKGDLLIVLDQSQLMADIISLRAKARTDQINYSRYEKLVRQGAASQFQLDQYRQAWIDSREALAAKEADREFRNLRAPISGVIADLKVKRGDVIKNGDPFTKLVRNDRLMVRVEVPSTYADQVRIGQLVRLSDPANDKPLATASVQSIDPVVSDGNQSLLAKAAIDNPDGRLRSGAKVRTRLILDQSRQLSIPFDAAQQIAGQSFVFVTGTLQQLRAKPDRADLGALAKYSPDTPVALQRAVSLGPIQNNRFPVLSGLLPGEAVITSNLINLRHGVLIRPKP